MKLLLLLVLVIILVVYFRKRKNRVPGTAVSRDEMHGLLQQNIVFYQRLTVEKQGLFRQRVQHFLDHVRITPVGEVSLTDLDKLYVAAAAIIPIHAYPDWAYNNLDEVLIYPGHFDGQYQHATEDARIMGMVGDGAMHRMMILSLPALRAGFENNATGNTGIHEFVHLLDKADGATDGIPELMLPKQLLAPWLEQMRRAIHHIRTEEANDINPYAGTNETEFFAVVSEYFFQKPDRLKEEHPELYRMLVTIYGYAGREQQTE